MAAVWVRVTSARVRLLLAASHLSSRISCEGYHEIENITVLVGLEYEEGQFFRADKRYFLKGTVG